MTASEWDDFYESDRISPDDLAELPIEQLLSRLLRARRRNKKWIEFAVDETCPPHKHDLRLQHNIETVLRMKVRKYTGSGLDDLPLLMMIRDALRKGGDDE